MHTHLDGTGATYTDSDRIGEHGAEWTADVAQQWSQVERQRALLLAELVCGIHWSE
jgi:hypothetical protein